MLSLVRRVACLLVVVALNSGVWTSFRAEAEWIGPISGTTTYSDVGNWQGGTIDDRFSGFTLPGTLTVTLAEDRAVAGDLYFNPSSNTNSNLVIQAATGLAPRVMTIDGKVLLDANMAGGKVTIGDGIRLKFTSQCEFSVYGSPTDYLAPQATLDLRGAVMEFGSGLDFRKSGPGMLIVGNKMSYGGTTYFVDGTTLLTANELLPNLSPVVFENGIRGILDLSDTIQTVGSISGGNSYGGIIKLGLNSQKPTGQLITGGNDLSTAYAGQITGYGTVTKVGSGVMTFQNANLYTGTMNILGGTLELSGVQSGGSTLLGGIASVTGLVLESGNTSDGATLRLNNNQFSSNSRIKDNATIAIKGGGGVIRIDGNAVSNTQEAVGALTLSSGAARIEVNNASGHSTTLTFASLASRSAGALVNFSATGGTLGLTGNNPIVKFSSAPNLGAWATVGDNDWAIYNTSYGIQAKTSYTTWNATNTSATADYLAAGDVMRTANGSALTLKLNPTVAQTITLNANLTLADKGGLLKTGAVDSTIQGAGALIATNELIIGSADPNGVLRLLAPLNITGAAPCLTKFGKGRVQIDNFTASPNWFANTVTVGGGTLEIVNNGNYTLSGALVGPTEATLAKSGSGVLTLSAATPSFGGRFEIGGGELRLAGTVATLQSMLTAERLRTLASNPQTGVGGYLTLSASDSAFVLPADSEWSDDKVGLKIIDSVLSGADVSFENYAVWNRELFINQGATVQVAATGLTINGKLGGHGTLIGGRVIAQGVLAPYASIGSLSVADDLMVANVFSAKLDPDNAQADALFVGGALQLGASSVLELSPMAPLDDSAYILASYGSLSGQFNDVRGLPEGYAVDYAYNGSQIAVVAVPEPATLALLLSCVAFAAAWHMRRNRRR